MAAWRSKERRLWRMTEFFPYTTACHIKNMLLVVGVSLLRLITTRINTEALPREEKHKNRKFWNIILWSENTKISLNQNDEKSLKKGMHCHLICQAWWWSLSEKDLLKGLTRVKSDNSWLFVQLHLSLKNTLLNRFPYWLKLIFCSDR